MRTTFFSWVCTALALFASLSLCDVRGGDGPSCHNHGGCRRDRCLRAMKKPSMSEDVSSLCGSFVQTAFAPTETACIPPAIASKCGPPDLVVTKVSSACSCLGFTSTPPSSTPSSSASSASTGASTGSSTGASTGSSAGSSAGSSTSSVTSYSTSTSTTSSSSTSSTPPEPTCEEVLVNGDAETGDMTGWETPISNKDALTVTNDDGNFAFVFEIKTYPLGGTFFSHNAAMQQFIDVCLVEEGTAASFTTSVTLDYRSTTPELDSETFACSAMVILNSENGQGGSGAGVNFFFSSSVPVDMTEEWQTIEIGPVSTFDDRDFFLWRLQVFIDCEDEGPVFLVDNIKLTPPSVEPL